MFQSTLDMGLKRSCCAINISGERRIEHFPMFLDGDLTIRDITQPVTFNVTASAVSDSQIEGTASAIVQRADYNLQIPSVPSVADVEEEVELYINFVANVT